jgi:uncharacterized protein YndB with AHSA1/START domain
MKHQESAPRGMLAAVMTTARGVAPDFVAAASSQAQIEITAPSERVWELLSNIERWPTWNSLVQKAVLSGPLTLGSVFTWKSKGFAVTSTLHEVTPARRIAWTGKAFGTRAIHAWELEETAQGTILKTAESFAGWLPTLMPRAMQRTLDRTLPAWLQAIKAEAERVRSEFAA